MQFNIYVPEQRKAVIVRLGEFASRTGRPRNEIVLEALEKFLTDQAVPTVKLGIFSLGETSLESRGELYEERLSGPHR